MGTVEAPDGREGGDGQTHHASLLPGDQIRGATKTEDGKERPLGPWAALIQGH